MDNLEKNTEVQGIKAIDLESFKAGFETLVWPLPFGKSLNIPSVKLLVKWNE